MKKCPFCGAEIEENARFCLYCMASLDEKELITKKKNKKRWLLIVAAVLVFVLLTLSVYSAFKNLLPLYPEEPSSSLAESSEKEEKEENGSSSEEPSSSLGGGNDSSSSEEGNSSENNSSSSSDENSSSSSEDNGSSSTPESSSQNQSSSSNTITSNNITYTDITPYLNYRTVDADSVEILSCKVPISGNVMIPETIDGRGVISIAKEVFAGNKNITAVKIQKATFCEEGIFDGCTSLKYADLNIFEFPEKLFKGCTGLIEVKLYNTPLCLNGVYIYKDIGKEMFSGCVNLKRVEAHFQEVPENAFYNCVSLTDVYATFDKKESKISPIGNDALLNAAWHKR